MTTFTLTLETATQAEIDAKLIAHIEARGYSVSNPHDNWETPGAFCRRLGLNVGHFRRALDHSAAPRVLTHRGPTGRVLQFLSTPAFDTFCLRNKPSVPSLP